MIGPKAAAGELPPFAKPLAVDLIVRPGGEVVLIELQHHFGRTGLLHLYPSAAARYRKVVSHLRRRYGVSRPLNEALRKVCANKVATWRTFGPLQPSSFVYQRWSGRVEAWRDGLSSDHILAKPPRGGCGRGILLFRRDRFGPDSIKGFLPGPLLLQEYLDSKDILDGEGLPHRGCIRHILIIVSNGERLGFIHLPAYWRVASTPFLARPSRDAFTANISTGAYAVPVEESDRLAVEAFSENIASALVRNLTGCGPVGRIPSLSLAMAGEMPRDRLAWERVDPFASPEPHPC